MPRATLSIDGRNTYFRSLNIEINNLSSFLIASSFVLLTRLGQY